MSSSRSHRTPLSNDARTWRIPVDTYYGIPQALRQPAIRDLEPQLMDRLQRDVSIPQNSAEVKHWAEHQNLEVSIYPTQIWVASTGLTAYQRLLETDSDMPKSSSRSASRRGDTPNQTLSLEERYAEKRKRQEEVMNRFKASQQRQRRQLEVQPNLYSADMEATRREKSHYTPPQPAVINRRNEPELRNRRKVESRSPNVGAATAETRPLPLPVFLRRAPRDEHQNNTIAEAPGPRELKPHTVNMRQGADAIPLYLPTTTYSAPDTAKYRPRHSPVGDNARHGSRRTVKDRTRGDYMRDMPVLLSEDNNQTCHSSYRDLTPSLESTGGSSTSINNNCMPHITIPRDEAARVDAGQPKATQTYPVYLGKSEKALETKPSLKLDTTFLSKSTEESEVKEATDKKATDKDAKIGDLIAEEHTAVEPIEEEANTDKPFSDPARESDISKDVPHHKERAAGSPVIESSDYTKAEVMGTTRGTANDANTPVSKIFRTAADSGRRNSGSNAHLVNEDEGRELGDDLENLSLNSENSSSPDIDDQLDGTSWEKVDVNGMDQEDELYHQVANPQNVGLIETARRKAWGWIR